MLRHVPSERAVRIGDAVGRGPFAGLPAGCPYATLFIAILTGKWRILRDLPTKPSVRSWVDDCTAFIQGREAAVNLATEAGATIEAMAKMSLKVNATSRESEAATPGLRRPCAQSPDRSSAAPRC